MRRTVFDAREPIDSTAASPIYRSEEMLHSQHLALRRVLLRIYEIAEREAAFEKELGRKNYLKLQRSRAPRQVFLFDGARGAGKTTLLITLQQLLRYLGRPGKEAMGERSAKPPRDLLKRLAREISKQAAPQRLAQEPGDADQRKFIVDLPNLKREGFSFFKAHNVDGVERRTAHFLPIVFPSDLEGGQPIMEGVFSRMSQALLTEIERSEKSGENDRGESRVQAKGRSATRQDFRYRGQGLVLIPSRRRRRHFARQRRLPRFPDENGRGQ